MVKTIFPPHGDAVTVRTDPGIHGEYWFDGEMLVMYHETVVAEWIQEFTGTTTTRSPSRGSLTTASVSSRWTWSLTSPQDTLAGDLVILYHRRVD